MREEKKRRQAWRHDIIGVLCLLVIVAIGVYSAVSAAAARHVGVDASQIPDDALTLTGTAAGRNGAITVEVVADESRIYNINIIEEQETENIGSLAVTQLPGKIFEEQSLTVDGISGATISSDAIRAAIANALISGNIDTLAFGISSADVTFLAAVTKKPVENHAQVVKSRTGITVLSAEDWKDQYPYEYATYQRNELNMSTTDYVADYPMISKVYEGMAFNKYYASARGHAYTVEDITSTGRPHKLANCFTCKTPDFTVMVNNEGAAAYSKTFEDVAAQVTQPISCYNCHANSGDELVITHTYLSDAMGDDLMSVDAATLSCAQCHVEYYFAPTTKATTLPYTSLKTMSPDNILAYYNNSSVDGQPFADYTNPRTGVRQIKVQHPEFETFMGEGSVHAMDMTCADCHMGKTLTVDGKEYTDHEYTSPLENENVLSTCAKCHADLTSEVRAIQSEAERRTYAIGYELEALTDRLAEAVSNAEKAAKIADVAAGATLKEGEELPVLPDDAVIYTQEELDAIRKVARDAQFYWDFVFVENSEGAHNSALTRQCLDKAEALCNQAMLMFR